jgi:hypothetical protein
MKLPITDQFLYDLYDFLKPAGEVVHLVTRRPKLGEALFVPGNPVYEKYRKARNRRNFNNLVYYLKRKNFIKSANLQGESGILLTKKGVEKAIRAGFKIENKELKKRIDGKWIMVIFDIPKNRFRTRKLLREILVNLGYKLFQHSVWISPYDVYNKTEELLQFYYLDKYIRVFIIDKV